jgi:hypothetical protein
MGMEREHPEHLNLLRAVGGALENDLLLRQGFALQQIRAIFKTQGGIFIENVFLISPVSLQVIKIAADSDKSKDSEWL